MAKTYRQQVATLGDLRRLPASFHPTAISLTPCSTNAVRPTTEKTPSSRNRTTPGKESDRACDGRLPGISKLLICDPKTKWRLPTGFQSQKVKPALGCPTFQNGDPQASRPLDTATRLSDLHRPFRCVSSHPSSQNVSEISTFPMGRPDLPVSHHSLWSFHRPLAIHKSDQTGTDLGPYAGYQGIRLSRRLDSSSRLVPKITPAYIPADQNDDQAGLDDKLGKVFPRPKPIIGTLGLRPQLQGYDVQFTGEKDQGHSEVNSFGDPTDESLPQDNTQPDHEDSRSRHGDFSDEHVHPSTHVLQEPLGSSPTSVGPRSRSATRRTARAAMVARKPRQVERSSTSQPRSRQDHLRRRQQCRLGRRWYGKVRSRGLVSRRSTRIHKLARAQGNRAHSSVFQVAEELHHPGPLGQHNRHSVHQQTGWHSVPLAQSISDIDLGNVSQKRSDSPGQAHTGLPEYGGGFRITPTPSQEHVANSSEHISDNCSDTLRQERRRSICGSHLSPSTKVCLLEKGSSSDSDGRSYHSVAEVQSPPCSPSVELDNGVSEETSSESSSCNGSSTVLAKRGLVPSASTNEPLPTLVARPSRTRSNHIAALALAVDKSKLEAIRLGCLKRKFQGSHYSLDASDTLLSHFTANTSSNRIYARAHHLFIAWCISYGVDVCYFTTTQLVNFLVAAHRSGYSINTIQVFKSAIMQLHLDRDTIDCDTDVRTLMKSFKKSGPLLSLTRPQVNIAATLSHLAKIPSNGRTALKALNQKTAFLLAMAAFLRPSDLLRIVLSKCTLDETGRLSLCIEAPKETRRGRPIIKILMVHPLANDDPLCPVAAFLALRNHPGTTQRPKDNLLVNSLTPSKPLSVNTISSWLRLLTKMSTDLVPVPSIRSLASDLALSRGVPKEDVVTLGNWSSDSVFEFHYRRSRLQKTNISAVVPCNSPT